MLNMEKIQKKYEEPQKTNNTLIFKDKRIENFTITQKDEKIYFDSEDGPEICFNIPYFVFATLNGELKVEASEKSYIRPMRW